MKPSPKEKKKDGEKQALDRREKRCELSVSFPKGKRRLIGRYFRYFTLTPRLNDPECIVPISNAFYQLQ